MAETFFSESRPVSSFRRFPEILEGARLHFGDVVVEQGKRILWQSRETFCEQHVDVEWAPSPDFERFQDDVRAVTTEMAVAADTLCLIVVATARYLRVAQIVYRLPVSRLGELERTVRLTDGRRPAAFCAPYGGARIDAYIALERDVARRGQFPWRKGAWLSHARFWVDTRTSPSVLPPRALTDEIRRSFGLPKGTVRWLDLGQNSTLQEWTEDVDVIYYVDKDVLDHCYATQGDSAWSQVLIVEMMLDFVRRVIRTARDELGRGAAPTSEELERSILGRVLKAWCSVDETPSAGRTLDQWLEVVREEPESVIAGIEARMDVLGMLRKAQQRG